MQQEHKMLKIIRSQNVCGHQSSFYFFKKSQWCYIAAWNILEWWMFLVGALLTLCNNSLTLQIYSGKGIAKTKDKTIDSKFLCWKLYVGTILSTGYCN